jgi:arylsulfatase
LWWREAERHQVLPLDNRAFADFVFERPPVAPAREKYVYWPGTGMVSEAAAVNVRSRDHTITAFVDGPGEGVLMSQGSLLGGWTLFVRNGTLTYMHNLSKWRAYRVDAPITLGPGPHRVGFRFTRTNEYGGGTGELLLDDTVVGRGEIKRFTPTRFSLTGVGLWCGRGGNLAVCDDYSGPFPWTGVLARVEVTVVGAPVIDAEAEAQAVIQTQ